MWTDSNEKTLFSFREIRNSGQSLEKVESHVIDPKYL